MQIGSPHVQKTSISVRIADADDVQRCLSSGSVTHVGTATHSSATTHTHVVSVPSANDEDAQDIAAARAAREEKASTVPYEDFRKELGL